MLDIWVHSVNNYTTHKNLCRKQWNCLSDIRHQTGMQSTCNTITETALAVVSKYYLWPYRFGCWL